MYGHRELKRVSRRLGTRCMQQKITLSTAESCTGGFIAKALTDIRGSSAWFTEGWVTYSNRAKILRLGISSSALNHHGAVSKAIACQMAAGALGKSRSDFAVAVTGIAGPDGGTPDKPVGTVWIAWAARVGSQPRLWAKCYRFSGNRDLVRRKTVRAALVGLLTRTR